MHKLKWNPLEARHVAYAPSRARRPRDVGDATEEVGKGPRSCVLCEGNESLTPPEVFAIRSNQRPNEGGWTVRVVPNLYPAVSGPGYYHEVVVHSPKHKIRLSDLEVAEVHGVAEAWRARLTEISKDPKTAYFQAGINQGGEAGASLEHTHSQLLALDFEPPVWASETKALSLASSCPLCDLVAEQKSKGKNLFVAEGEEAVALCPPWSGFAYEVLVFPYDHLSSISQSPKILEWVLFLLAKVDTALRGALGNAPFNVVLHTSLGARDPVRMRKQQMTASILNSARDEAGGFHWHTHLYPRIQALASIELGSGIYIQTSDPSSWAEKIRQFL